MLAIAVAMLAQTVAFGAHAARAGEDPRAAAAALSQVLGSPVVLCVQDEGAPADNDACAHACPFCQLAAQTSAMTAPSALAELAAPLGVVADPPAIAAAARPRTPPIGLPFARGPPRSL